MQITLPLDQMTYEEKWAVIEAIYADLDRRGQLIPADQAVDWHGAVVAERLERLRSGEGQLIDLDDVDVHLGDILK